MKKKISLIFCLLFFISLLVTAHAAESAPEANPGSEGATQFYNPALHMWYGTRDLPNPQTVLLLGAGGAATIAAFTLADSTVKKFYAGNDRMKGWEWGGNNILGSGVFGLTIGIGTFATGLLFHRDHEIDAGEAHLEGLLANLLYTSALKYTIRRSRPDSSNRQSFPSGHTSTIFTSAANLMDMYGPWVGVPTIALGVYTAVGRLASNAHHLSDVIFGGTLGYIVGHAYTLHHIKDNNRDKTVKTAWMVYPFYESSQQFGANLEIRF